MYFDFKDTCGDLGTVNVVCHANHLYYVADICRKSDHLEMIITEEIVIVPFYKIVRWQHFTIFAEKGNGLIRIHFLER